jgi:hypothetical protein
MRKGPKGGAEWTLARSQLTKQPSDWHRCYSQGKLHVVAGGWEESSEGMRAGRQSRDGPRRHVCVADVHQRGGRRPQ